MNGLQTSRVVVIDDDASEAIPVIKSLGRLGIGCTYIPGDKVEELPATPLVGIRLVFLDMQLGTSGNDRTVGVQTANVFARVVAPATEPILVVLWTKHPDYVDAFKNALFEAYPAFRSGLLVSAIEKPAKSADIDIEKILAGIGDALKQHSPVETIWFWEQIAHDAASDTTAALAKIVSTRANIQPTDDDATRMAKWKVGLSHIYRSLLQAVVGKGAGVETAFGDLLLAMAQLHQDRIEGQISGYGKVSMDAVFSEDVKWRGPSEDERLIVNTMLLTGPVRTGDLAVRAGNVYTPLDSEGCPHKLCGLSGEMMLQEVFKFSNDVSYRQAAESAKTYRYRKEHANGDLAKEKDNAGKEAIENNKMASRINEILASCLPAMAELTPSCDYDQRNCHVARFAGGFFVPQAFRNVVEASRESLRIIEPIRIPGKDGVWSLVLSARFPISIIDPKRIGTQAVFRLRTAVLLDVQNWFAAQSARPGYVKMEQAI